MTDFEEWMLDEQMPEVKEHTHITVRDVYENIQAEAFIHFYYVENLTTDKANRKSNIVAVKNAWKEFNKEREFNG